MARRMDATDSDRPLTPDGRERLARTMTLYERMRSAGVVSQEMRDEAVQSALATAARAWHDEGAGL